MWCKGNLFWGNHLRCFGDKISLNEPQVLSRSFRAKTTQSTTAITSIAIRVANRLRIKREFLIFRHTERSEVSKSCDFNQTKDAMTQNSESYTFTQSKQVANDSKVAKMDSSLRATRYAQNDESLDSPKQFNKSCDSTPNLARFVVQKIGFKGRSSASADFLLESDKRGSPPKSEKAAAFWRVGGAGRGVQPFLQKDSNDKNSVDLKADLIAESHKKIDSKFALDSCDLDSSRCRAQNDDMIDCFGDELPRNDDRTDCYEISRHTERSEVSKSCDFNQAKDAMTQNSESYRFAQSKQVANDSKVAKMDSSLRATLRMTNLAWIALGKALAMTMFRESLCFKTPAKRLSKF